MKNAEGPVRFRRIISLVGIVVIGFALIVALRTPQPDRVMLAGMVGFLLASVWMFASSFSPRVKAIKPLDR